MRVNRRWLLTRGLGVGLGGVAIGHYGIGRNPKEARISKLQYEVTKSGKAHSLAHPIKIDPNFSALNQFVGENYPGYGLDQNRVYFRGAVTGLSELNWNPSNFIQNPDIELGEERVLDETEHILSKWFFKSSDGSKLPFNGKNSRGEVFVKQKIVALENGGKHYAYVLSTNPESNLRRRQVSVLATGASNNIIGAIPPAEEIVNWSFANGVPMDIYMVELPGHGIFGGQNVAAATGPNHLGENKHGTLIESPANHRDYAEYYHQIFDNLGVYLNRKYSEGAKMFFNAVSTSVPFMLDTADKLKQEGRKIAFVGNSPFIGQTNSTPLLNPSIEDLIFSLVHSVFSNSARFRSLCHTFKFTPKQMTDFRGAANNLWTIGGNQKANNLSHRSYEPSRFISNAAKTERTLVDNSGVERIPTLAATRDLMTNPNGPNAGIYPYFWKGDVGNYALQTLRQGLSSLKDPDGAPQYIKIVYSQGDKTVDPISGSREFSEVFGEDSILIVSGAEHNPLAYGTLREFDQAFRKPFKEAMDWLQNN